MGSSCKILVGTTHGDDVRYPVSRDGWTNARNEVYALRDKRGAAFATLICKSGSIPLYQCYKNEPCAIEGSSGGTALSGARRKRKRG